MQTLIRMDKVVIKDYDHIRTVDENMNWRLLLICFSTPYGPLLYIYFYFKKIKSLPRCTH